MQKLIAFILLLVVFQSCHDDILAKNPKAKARNQGTVKRNPKPAASQIATNQGDVKTDKITNQGTSKRNPKLAASQGVTNQGEVTDKVANQGTVTYPKAANQGSVKNPRVAIIGNTLSGALSSYYLHKLHPKIIIHVYEHIENRQSDTDLSIHTNSLYMREIIEEKGLQIENYYRRNKPIIYDGVQNNLFNVEIFKNQNSELYKKISDFLASSFKDFSNIYEFQKIEKSVTNVKDLLSAMSKDFEGYLNKSVNDLLDQTIDSDKNSKKFFEVLVLRAYLQKCDIHAFAGLMSFWFSEFTGNMEQVAGEFADIAKKLFDENDLIFPNKVSGVYRRNNKNFIQSIKFGDETEKPEKRGYDFVIVAEPDTKFLDPKLIQKNNIHCEYNMVMMTVIKGYLKKDCFKIENSEQVTHVINTKDGYLGGLSASQPTVWGLISYAPLLSNQIRNIFDKSELVAIISEMEGYPNYLKYECAQQATFDLGKNFYHVSSVAWASSITEMIAIGAKNVALLINSKIYG